jgi:hypothetical protein
MRLAFTLGLFAFTLGLFTVAAMLAWLAVETRGVQRAIDRYAKEMGFWSANLGRLTPHHDPMEATWPIPHEERG